MVCKHHEKYEKLVDKHPGLISNPSFFLTGERQPMLKHPKRRPRTVPHASPDASPDYTGVLLLADMSRLLRTSAQTIEVAVRNGTFAIPTLPRQGIDRRLRWSGPVVKRWLDANGNAPLGGTL
jgi:hypothetical protein